MKSLMLNSITILIDRINNNLISLLTSYSESNYWNDPELYIKFEIKEVEL